RTLRTTFSHTSAPAATLPGSILSSARPAVLRRSLWQVTQYRSIVARESTGGRDAAGVCAGGRAAARGSAAWGASPHSDAPQHATANAKTRLFIDESQPPDTHRRRETAAKLNFNIDLRVPDRP